MVNFLGLKNLLNSTVPLKKYSRKIEKFKTLKVSDWAWNLACKIVVWKIQDG